MVKKLILAAVIFFSMVLFAKAEGAQDGKNRVSGTEITHSLIVEDVLKEQLDYLCDSVCAGRATGSAGSRKSAEWIADKFDALGMTAPGGGRFQYFRAPDGSTGCNIVGLMKTRKSPASRSCVLVTAHYDGLGYLGGNMYPGADSNASGVVGMLGIAQMISSMVRYGKNYYRDVLFVATDAKELNMAGMQDVWEMIGEEGLDVVLHVNIDQIGGVSATLPSGRKDYMIMLSAPDAAYYRSVLTGANTRYGLDMDLAMDYYGSKDFTQLFYRKVGEQKIFLQHGKPAVMFTSGITMNNNKTYDTPDTLDMGVLKKRICLIFHWMDRII